MPSDRTRSIRRGAKQAAPDFSRADLFNEILATLLIACMAAPTLGVAGTAACIGITGAMAAIAWQTGRVRLQWLTLLIFPLFAVASTLWSGLAVLTLKYALQLLLTVVGGLVIAMLLKPRAFVRTVFMAATLVCILSILDGTKGPSTLGPVLTGLTGSKNAMASAANMLVLAGIAILFDSRQPGIVRAMTVPAMGMAVEIIATGHAATTIILTVLAVPLYLVLWLFNRLPLAGRIPVLVAALVVATPVAIVAPQLEALGSDYIFRTFQKDKSLTGRRYLWDVADQLAAERPMLGFGYKYIWMSYSPAATGMLRSQHIKDPRTFSMHHTYREIQVDLGLVGLALLVTLFAVGCGFIAYAALFQGDASNYFFFVMAASLMIRSFAETFIAPFYVYTPIFFAIAAYGMFRQETGDGRSDRGPIRRGGFGDRPFSKLRRARLRANDGN